MKKLLTCVSLFTLFISSAQIDIGIKAGLNYNSLDDLKVRGGIAGFNETIKSEGRIGFHAGIFAQYSFTKLYIKGELFYIQNSSEFDNTLAPASTLKISTLEVPILVGLNVTGPLKLYVGPSLVYTIDSDFTDFFDLEFERDLSFAYNIGATISIKKIDIDLRYSSGFSENLASYLDQLVVDGLGYSINTRPSQFLLSLSYTIN